MTHMYASGTVKIMGWILGLLLTVGLFHAPDARAAQQQVAAELEIEPNTFYELTFDAAEVSGASQWMIHMRTADGDLPYDGVVMRPWQRLSTERTSYSHAFLSSRDAATLQLLVTHEGAAPRVTNVKLSPIEPPHLILNGDLSRGLADYSGWPTRSGSELVEHEGETALRVDTNGYVLGEYFPVVGGAGYRHTRGSHTWPGVSLLAYDANKRLIARVPHDATETPAIRMPDDATYARLMLHTSHDHIPSHRVIHFTGAGLELLSEDAAKQPTGPAADAADAFGEIVLPGGSDGREERAARELRHWLEEITGTALPLLAEPSGRDRLRFHVGAALASAYDEDLNALAGSDGYAVRRQGDDVYIFGASSRGTLFGVYRFLEKNTDIIWPRPNPEFEAIYSTNQPLELKETDFRSRPSFWGRYISNRYTYESSYVFQDWLARNGLNAPHSMHRGLDYLSWARGAMVGYNGSHISWASPGEEDQDLYPLVDGTRDVSRWRQPCYTHPELADRIVNNVRERMETLAGRDIEPEYLHITIADNWTVCACDECMQPIELADGSVLEPQSKYANKDPRFFSTRNFIMLNKVAEALSGDYPDLKIQTHAYIFTAETPAVELHPSIVPQYAAYPTQNLRYPIMAGQGRDLSIYRKDTWKRRFTQWDAKDTVDLGYFGYYYVSGFNAVAESAAADYRDLLNFGGIQAHTEGYPVDSEDLSSWDYDSIEKWVIARLMWDPHQDPAELRRHYIERVYRGAAPVMTQFHQLIHDAWHGAPEDVFINCHTSEQEVFEHFVIEPGLQSQLRDLLSQAQAAADHPVSREMIDRQLAQLDDFTQRLGQQSVPYVEESTHEWSDAGSPHWEKAAVFKDFKLVDDWRQFDQQPAEQQTVASLMHDRGYLYVRLTAYDDDLNGLVVPEESGVGVFPQGDRVELVLRTQEKHTYFMAAGPNGAFFAQPGVEAQVAAARSASDDAWVAMLAIPLSDIQWSPDTPSIDLRVGRVYRHTPDERLESSLSGGSIFNRADQFWTSLRLTD